MGRTGRDSGSSAREGFSRAYSGGIVVTVVGSLAAERLDEWRAGRRVRLPVQLRRPSRYLDPGVPDQERALARRGTTLVGTVKSGALVDVLARGSWLDGGDGGCARLCAARDRRRRSAGGARSRPRSSRRSSSAIAPASTHDVQRRLQEAGTYHVIAISGGNIAILARARNHQIYEDRNVGVLIRHSFRNKVLEGQFWSWAQSKVEGGPPQQGGSRGRDRHR